MKFMKKTFARLNMQKAIGDPHPYRLPSWRSEPGHSHEMEDARRRAEKGQMEIFQLSEALREGEDGWLSSCRRFLAKSGLGHHVPPSKYKELCAPGLVPAGSDQDRCSFWRFFQARAAFPKPSTSGVGITCS